jgi:hypothetical protein
LKRHSPPALIDALGPPDEGLRFREKARARHAESWLVLAEIANSCWNQRRYDDPIGWAKRVLDTDPRHLLGGEFLAGAYLPQGDVEQIAFSSRDSVGCDPSGVHPSPATTWNLGSWRSRFASLPSSYPATI